MSRERHVGDLRKEEMPGTLTSVEQYHCGADDWEPGRDYGERTVRVRSKAMRDLASEHTQPESSSPFVSRSGWSFLSANPMVEEPL